MCQSMKKLHQCVIEISCQSFSLLSFQHLEKTSRWWYHEKKVFIYSLDGDYKQDKFGEVLDLIPYCDYIEKRKAICKKCKGHAIFTNRICNDKSQVLVGANVEYEPLCRSCYKNIQQNDEISLD